jgi:diguanylate cyclase (GGDEF)-like protein
MELFANDDEVSALEARLKQADDAASPALLTALAWQLRQRDTHRALTLAERAEGLLAGFDSADVECRRLAARILLIRAEADWLFGRFDLAMNAASQAVADFLELEDHAAAGDGQLTMAGIWHEQGAFDRRDSCLSSAAIEYASASDSRRSELVALRIAYHATFGSAPGSRDALPQACPGRDHPMILVWKHAIRALSSNMDGNFGDSVKHSIDAYEAACRSGQIRQAIIFALGVGNAFEYLNDLDAAIEWIETALELAEKAQWPALIGLGWYYVGAVMIKLNRPEEAMTFLRDAVRVLAPFGESANYNAACLLLGSELMKSPGNEQEALTLLQQGKSIAQRLGTVDALFLSRSDLARLLVRLRRFDEAAREIEAALCIARDYGNGDWLLSTLRVQADLRRHGFAPDVDGEQTVLACLDRALAVARTLKDFIVPPDLLEEVAAEHAKCGDLATAYSLALEAGQSRDRIHGNQAGARAVAMQVRHETAQLRAEAQHQKQLNEAQAQRADVLQHSLSTLEELGAIGREITSSLYADDLFAVLHRHAQRLLDATVFMIYRFDAEQSALNLAFGVEAGRPIAPGRIALNDATSVAARCARERQEIGVDEAPDAAKLLPGTIDTASLLYAPLLNGDQLHGLMSIQSPKSHAYGERERAIFRTLCAYGAIALANAQAMASLRAVEEKLVEQNAELEQLATTDRLTGLFNRLYLDRKLQNELVAAERYGTVFSLIILDMDQFKHVNDTYGHVAGDAVLVAMASILKGRHRATDIVGRWGGEEFLVICPYTPVNGALTVAESLRRSVERHDFPHVGHRTASFGVAAYRVGDSIVSLTARADKGLYRAKDSGRNRVGVDDLYQTNG